MSEHCLDRILNKKVTSEHLVMVVGCKSDYVDVGFNAKFHKYEAGILIVSLDIVSLFIMAFFFGKLKKMNEEYLDIMDSMTVQMKDFAIRIDDVAMDKYT